MKYFVVVEGRDRAILRSSIEKALEKKETLQKYFPGKKIFIFESDRKVV